MKATTTSRLIKAFVSLLVCGVLFASIGFGQGNNGNGNGDGNGGSSQDPRDPNGKATGNPHVSPA
jgi:hypothetical protein